MYGVLFIVVTIFVAGFVVGRWSAAKELWWARFHNIIGMLSNFSNVFASEDYPWLARSTQAWSALGGTSAMAPVLMYLAQRRQLARLGA